MNLKPILILSLLSAGRMLAHTSAPADSVAGNTYQLEEFTISSTGSHKIIDRSHDGALTMNARFLLEQPSLMGSADPIAFLKTLPSFQSTSELVAGLFVRGSGNGANHFEADGARIINPMHMLGFYSTFNPDFYKTYSIRTGFLPSTLPDATAGYVAASSGFDVAESFSGTLSAGVIESHAAFSTPILKNKTSLSFGLRHAYPNLIFPNIMKLGSSKLHYDFTDANMTIHSLVSGTDHLRISAFFNKDNMDLENELQSSLAGNFGWSNFASAATWIHNRLSATVSFSHFSNKFRMKQGGKTINLPSDLSQLTLNTTFTASKFNLASDLTWRNTSGQHNVDLSPSSPDMRSHSFEWNLAGNTEIYVSRKVHVDVGARLSAYISGNFFIIHPQPRVNLRYSPTENLNISASYGRYMRFDRLIEETSGGLPADFWTCANRDIMPEDVNTFDAGIQTTIPLINAGFSFDAYFKILRHSLEFDATLLDFASPLFHPLDHIADGNGYAYGFSIMMTRQFGKFRGRTAYSFGKSKLKFDKFGESYFPSSHDRTHDLNISLSYDILPTLMAAASFTHATGTPYTKAKYGYMIGENLICEYYPHNSSRLPDYNRLDLSLTWRFANGKNVKQSLNFSVYNALASRNVLFIFTDYSKDHGLRIRESAMESIVPSLSYIIEFN